MLSDQFGRRRTLQISYIIIIIGNLFAAYGIWEQSLLLLILGRVVTGIGAGNNSVINSAVADLSKSKEKAKNFGLVTMASGLGFTAGPFFGGKLAGWGYEAPFIFAALLMMLTLIFFNLFFLETFHFKKEEHPWAAFKTRVRHLFQLPSFGKFRIFFPAFFIFCFGWSFFWEFISVTWIKIYGLNVSQIGNFYAYGSLFYVLSSGLLIRPIVNKFKSKFILIVAWFLLGIFLLLLFDARLWFYWICIPIQQFLIALTFPVGTAVVSDAVSESRQGEFLGTFQSLQAFAFAITPFVGGVLLNLSFYAPLILSGTAMLIGGLILLLGYRSKYV